MDELQATMVAAYARRMDGRTIGLKRARSLFDDLLADQADLTGIERHRLAMERFHERKQRPEYEGYRRREEWASGTCSGTTGAIEDRRHDGADGNRTANKLAGPRAWWERFGRWGTSRA